jgi:CheY-like chemotaxis protein
VPSTPPALPEPLVTKRPKRIVMVDDSVAYAETWRKDLEARYGEKVTFESYANPIQAIPILGPGIDLLILDLEMPVFDGRKLAALAAQRGVPCKRIVIVSAHDADELHALFSTETCLAVINKTEPRQQQAFLMILDSVVKR